MHTGVVLAVPNGQALQQTQRDAQPTTAAVAEGSRAAGVASTSGADAAPYIHTFSCTTDVTFDELPPELIRAYIESGRQCCSM